LEVVYEKSIGTKMNDLDLCLEVVSRSRPQLRYIWRWISRKPLEIEAWFQGPPIGNVIWAIKWSRDRWCHVTPKVLWGSTVGYASDSLASCLIKELVVTQDDTRSHLQCTEAVYGDESEAVWQLHTTIQARGPEVSSTIDNFWYSLENLEILGNFLIPENCGNLKFTREKSCYHKWWLCCAVCQHFW